MGIAIPHILTRNIIFRPCLSISTHFGRGWLRPKPAGWIGTLDTLPSPSHPNPIPVTVTESQAARQKTLGGGLGRSNTPRCSHMYRKRVRGKHRSPSTQDHVSTIWRSAICSYRGIYPLNPHTPTASHRVGMGTFKRASIQSTGGKTVDLTKETSPAKSKMESIEALKSDPILDKLSPVKPSFVYRKAPNLKSTLVNNVVYLHPSPMDFTLVLTASHIEPWEWSPHPS